MDFTLPISALMTRKLITVMPNEPLTKIMEIFDNNRIHHIPVVKYTTIVGLISREDLAQFISGVSHSGRGQRFNPDALQFYTAEDVMTAGMATLESSDRLNVAIELFAENLFHAIPVVDNGDLVGILTTLDIIKALKEEDNERIKHQQFAEL